MSSVHWLSQLAFPAAIVSRSDGKANEPAPSPPIIGSSMGRSAVCSAGDQRREGKVAREDDAFNRSSVGAVSFAVGEVSSRMCGAAVQEPVKDRARGSERLKRGRLPCLRLTLPKLKSTSCHVVRLRSADTSSSVLPIHAMPRSKDNCLCQTGSDDPIYTTFVQLTIRPADR